MQEDQRNKDLSEVGQSIWRFRREAGHNQEKLAELANVSVNTIHRAEAGKSGIALDTIFAISDALKIPIEKFCPARFVNGTLDEEMKEMEILYNKLSQSNKKIVLETITPLINILLLHQSA